ncbi:MAG TPA: hypothetical protein VHH55_01925 [Gaiellaceae bacterium]|nr:hypothetical protein [Gaiellaceae bacterium]
MLRLGLVVFVVAWIFGPYWLRSAIPIWLPFLIALGLEVQFFVSALHAAPAERPDRGPLRADRERFGYREDAEELVLVRDGDDELWIPYAGESEDELEARIEEARAEPLDDAPVVAAPRDRGRALRRLAAGLGVIAGLAVLFWVVEERTGWNGLDESARAEATARFSDEASRVAGKPVRVECDESGERVGAVQHADGVAIVGGDRAWLTPERCLDLYRLAFDDEVRSNRTGLAIAVLAHEAWHLRGVSDEGTTECYALQSGVGLGQRLGLSEGRARALMQRQLTQNAVRSASAPAYRIPADCRDGGRLDLSPESSRFP